jgi:S-DNA-T family DNA segregation ATPase FtsK/SpoIIIE
MGCGLILFASLYLVSLLSYNTADPSFNTASSGDISNWGGSAGAYIADVSVQIIGAASVFIALVTLTWGVVLLRKSRLKRVWLRFSSLLMALMFGAGFFATMPSPSSWPVQAGLGGILGDFLTRGLIEKLTSIPLFFAFFGITTVLVTIALGLTWWQWKQIFANIRYSVSVVMGLISGLVRMMFSKNPESVSMARPKRKPAGQMLKKQSAKVIGLIKEPEDDKDPQQKLFKIEKSTKPKQPKKTSSLANTNYQLPPISLLSEPKHSRKAQVSETALTQNGRMLESVLEDFGVHGRITKIRPGPVVTLYELEPAAGTKSSRVIGLADDIARSMSSISARISVIPGKNALGIELPNTHRESVFLREIIESDLFIEGDANLPMALGKNIGGEPVMVDLSKMPHLLVAGTTGSGKSVGVNGMIISLLNKLTPDQCKFIMIDPKMLELSIYDGIPHLLAPVVTDPTKAVVALKWTVKEMENRYRLMSTMGVRNIIGYNQRILEAIAKGENLTRMVQTGFNPETGKPIIEEVPLEMSTLPYIVVVVDEMADLMLVAGKDIEGSIQRLAQMARAAGIHIIMATQRPSVDVITGVIKANFPTRISFQVTSKIDSRTILGEQGAEQLLGMGDMLHMAGGGRITRVHGAFVSDQEVEETVKFLKAQGTPEYIEDVTAGDGDSSSDGGGDGEDDLYRQAVQIVMNEGKVSTSYIQRRLRIGYNKAANLVEEMEQNGVISPPNHAGKREILSSAR